MRRDNDLLTSSLERDRNANRLARWHAKHGPIRWRAQALSEGREDLIDAAGGIFRRDGAERAALRHDFQGAVKRLQQLLARQAAARRTA